MHCPYCNASETKVIDSRLAAEGAQVRRRRSCNIDEQEAMISRIEKRVRQMGEREISSKVLGEIIMSELKTLDDVAYVRFASVYRDFQDIDAFHQEIANIRPNEK